MLLACPRGSLAMDDDGLTLNLSRSNQPLGSRGRSAAITGGRRDRIQQRRALKRELAAPAGGGGGRQSASDVDWPSAAAASPERKRPKPSGLFHVDRHGGESRRSGGDRNGGGHDEAEGARAAKRRSAPPSGQVISSLFKNNPEIPVIESSHIRTIKEAIFSSDAFADAGLHPYLVSCLEKRLGVQRMTLVQQRAMPAIIAGRDALIKSQTGSGKTLAYALPIVQALRDMEQPRLSRSDGVHAIVLVPTRELALQTLQVFQHLLQASVWIVAGCVIGGEAKKSEKSRLRKGVNVLVATPGRVLDHLQHTACLSLARVRWVVIDEADRLLDLGFEKDVTQVLHAVDEATTAAAVAERPGRVGSGQRQTVLLSATLTAGVQRLAQLALRDPYTVDVAARDKSVECATSAAAAGSNSSRMTSGGGESFAVPEKLRQHVVICPGKLRLVCLAAFLLGKCTTHDGPQHKIIVFMSTQDMVEFHYTLFKRVLSFDDDSDADDDDEEEDGDDNADGGGDSRRQRRGGGNKRLRLFSLHGDMEQKERTKAFRDFTNSRSGVLLCTDVAARGLDLPHVDWIVQHCAPPSVEDYVHRIGRTARIGSAGSSLLFLMPSEADYVGVLNSHKMRVCEVNHEDILANLMLESDNLCGRGRKKHPSTLAECATALQQMFEEHVYSDKDVLALAKKAYRSFIRAYATYPASIKNVFHIKKLHLGHVAKCFCLRDAPTRLSTPAKQLKRRGRMTVGMKHSAQGGRRKVTKSKTKQHRDAPQKQQADDFS